VFQLFFVIIPIFSNGLLLAVVVIPMNKKMLKLLIITMEVLRSWASLEVLMLGMVGSIFQIKQFIFFMIGDRCDIINLTLHIFSHVIKDPLCFDVEMNLEYGFGVLFLNLVV